MICSAAPELAQKATLLVCIVQPADWRVYITPALVFLSAVIALAALFNARRVAREKATLDLIEKVESGDHYRKINHTFSILRRGAGFAKLSNPQSEEDKNTRREVNDYLNHYELVSIGILNGMLDEKVYRTWMRGPFVRDWNAAADWIQRERWKRDDQGQWEYYGQIFQNYQVIACRWSHEAIALSATYAAPPTDQEAGGPGDEAMPSDASEERSV